MSFMQKLALREYESNIQTLKHETSELEFELNVIKMKNQEITKENAKEVNKLKNDFDSQK